MAKNDYERCLSVSHRMAAVRAANVVASLQMPSDLRRDFLQEALLQLWRMRHAYDPSRGVGEHSPNASLQIV
jgi:hypothetical protein